MSNDLKTPVNTGFQGFWFGALMAGVILGGCAGGGWWLASKVSRVPQISPPAQREIPFTPEYTSGTSIARSRGIFEGLTSEQAQLVVDYYREIGMAAEFGGACSGVTCRWVDDDITVSIHGSPTREDLATLDAVIQDLQRIGGFNLRVLRDYSSDISVHFRPESEFRQVLPQYTPTNMGFFWTTMNNSRIKGAVVLIDSTKAITQQERSHLIREELTQSLGLMQDSERYDDSIFYQGWTAVQDYSPLDIWAIFVLSKVEPGMNKSEFCQWVITEAAMNNLKVECE